MKRKIILLVISILLICSTNVFAYQKISEGGEWFARVNDSNYRVTLWNHASKATIKYANPKEILMIENVDVIYEHNDNHYEVYYDDDGFGAKGYFVLYADRKYNLTVTSYITDTSRQTGRGWTFPNGKSYILRPVHD